MVLPAELFSGLGQGFLVLDESGLVIQATGTAADLLDTTTDALVGRPCPLHPPRPSAHAVTHPHEEEQTAPLPRTAAAVPPSAQPNTGWFASAPSPGNRPGAGALPSPRAATSSGGVPSARTPAARNHDDSGHHGRAAERRPAFPAERWTHRVNLRTGAARRLLITSTSLPGGRALSLVDITDVHAEDQGRPDLAAARRLTELALWEYRLETDELVLSREMLALLGLPSGSRVDLDTWHSWLDPEDRDVFHRLKREAATGRANWRLLLRVTPPDGKARYLRHWCSLSLDPSRIPVSIAGACLDVTAGGVAAEELRTSRHRLQAAVRLTGLASWSMRADGSHLWWSEGMYAMFGKDQATFVPTAQEHFDLTHDDDLPRLLRCIDEVIATGAPDEIDLRVTSPQGLRHLRCWIDVTVDDDLQQTVLGTVLDVTEQAKTLQALQAQREEFRLAFHAAPIGMAVLLVDDEQRRTVRRVNPELRDMLGLPPGDLTDEQLLASFSPDDRRTHARALTELCTGEATETDYEVTFNRPDGEEGHLWVRAGIARDLPGRHGGRTQVLYHVLDVTQRERDRRQLHKLAMSDPLTGLANRAMFSTCLDEQLAAANTAGALLLVDLDRFKAVNDTLGHVAGDALLTEVARRLRSASPAESLVARLGGDEFAVLVRRGLPVADLVRVGERLRAALAEPYILGAADDVTCTATIGVADFAAPGLRATDVYREADLALYAAKAAGRNAVVVADEALRERVRSRRRSERVVADALAGDRITIEWQPALDLATGQVVGHEALARLDDGEGRVLMPDVFLPIAEEMRAVADLDARITELAIRHLAIPGSLGYAAVNVSTRTLAGGGYVEHVRAMLDEYGVAPQRLLIELEESSLLAADSDGTGEGPAERAVRALHQMGVRIGLDDFGTGYSALANLERFPLDVLKLDRTFVARLGGSPTAESLVKAVVALAHGYGMVVTAEGVETQDQVDTLHRVGCDRAQGWLFDARTHPTAGDPWRTA